MRFRPILFWSHLAAGVAVGAVILSMSVTGMLLSFEPQIVDWSEKRVRQAEPPAAEARKLGLDSLVALARAEMPGLAPSEIRVWSDPAATVALNLGKDKGSVYVDAYSGRIAGKDSRAYFFLRQVEEWHRWLGSRKIWKPVIDAVCLAFLFMVLSGLYLWWPRRWSRAALRGTAVPRLGLKGKAREWNWHNAFGLWAAPLLLIITVTGSVIGYRWAGDLLFVLTGNTPPPRPLEDKAGGKDKPDRREGGRPRGERRAEAASPAPQGPAGTPLDSLFAAAERRTYRTGTASASAPEEAATARWTSIGIRLPQKPGAPVTVLIQSPGFWGQYTRSQLTLDAATAETKKWEPYSGFNLGRKLRGWMVPIHTGRAGGIAGQSLAALAAFAAGLLVWTGIAMAVRRLFKARAGKNRILREADLVHSGPAPHISNSIKE